MQLTNCKYCGAETTIKNKTAKNHFCDKTCYDKFQNKKIDVICDNCEKIFSISHVKACNKIKFCSRECSEEFRRKPNKIIIKENHAEMIIDSETHGLIYIFIDIEDINKVNKFRWCLTGKENNLYVRSKNLLLHRYLLGCNEKLVVDHINGNTFDNRKSNLRICTQLVNMHNRTKSKNNTTGYTGVGLTKNGKYIARIFLNKKFINLGTFDSLEEAVEKRNNAKKEMEVLLSNFIY